MAVTLSSDPDRGRNSHLTAMPASAREEVLVVGAIDKGGVTADRVFGGTPDEFRKTLTDKTASSCTGGTRRGLPFGGHRPWARGPVGAVQNQGRRSVRSVLIHTSARERVDRIPDTT